eukprot:snap_masked-scaffold_31-processed-gene-3.24-mRNA-1 protein AED:1.00 eAED:1.00 QI:0/-1/0/0/-1/1/1/0/1761
MLNSKVLYITKDIDELLGKLVEAKKKVIQIRNTLNSENKDFEVTFRSIDATNEVQLIQHKLKLLQKQKLVLENDIQGSWDSMMHQKSIRATDEPGQRTKLLACMAEKFFTDFYLECKSNGESPFCNCSTPTPLPNEVENFVFDQRVKEKLNNSASIIQRGLRKTFIIKASIRLQSELRTQEGIRRHMILSKHARLEADRLFLLKREAIQSRHFKLWKWFCTLARLEEKVNSYLNGKRFCLLRIYFSRWLTFHESLAVYVSRTKILFSKVLVDLQIFSFRGITNKSRFFYRWKKYSNILSRVRAALIFLEPIAVNNFKLLRKEALEKWRRFTRQVMLCRIPVRRMIQKVFLKSLLSHVGLGFLHWKQRTYQEKAMTRLFYLIRNQQEASMLLLRKTGFSRWYDKTLYIRSESKLIRNLHLERFFRKLYCEQNSLRYAFLSWRSKVEECIFQQLENEKCLSMLIIFTQANLYQSWKTWMSHLEAKLAWQSSGALTIQVCYLRYKIRRQIYEHAKSLRKKIFVMSTRIAVCYRRHAARSRFYRALFVHRSVIKFQKIYRSFYIRNSFRKFLVDFLQRTIDKSNFNIGQDCLFSSVFFLFSSLKSQYVSYSRAALKLYSFAKRYLHFAGALTEQGLGLFLFFGCYYVIPKLVRFCKTDYSDKLWLNSKITAVKYILMGINKSVLEPRIEQNVYLLLDYFLGQRLVLSLDDDPSFFYHVVETRNLKILRYFIDTFLKSAKITCTSKAGIHENPTKDFWLLALINQTDLKCYLYRNINDPGIFPCLDYLTTKYLFLDKQFVFSVIHFVNPENFEKCVQFILETYVNPLSNNIHLGAMWNYLPTLLKDSSANYPGNTHNPFQFLDDEDHSVLFYAVRNINYRRSTGSCVYMLRCLSQYCTHFPVVNSRGESLLHLACQFADSQALELMLEFEIEINRTTRDTGDAAIHVAAMKGSLKCLKLLVFNHANYLIQNFDGDLPLHLAVRHGHAKVAKFLIKYDYEFNHGGEHKENYVVLNPMVSVRNYRGVTYLGEARFIGSLKKSQVFIDIFLEYYNEEKKDIICENIRNKQATIAEPSRTKPSFSKSEWKIVVEFFSRGLISIGVYLRVSLEQHVIDIHSNQGLWIHNLLENPLLLAENSANTNHVTAIIEVYKKLVINDLDGSCFYINRLESSPFVAGWFPGDIQPKVSKTVLARLILCGKHQQVPFSTETTFMNTSFNTYCPLEKQQITKNPIVAFGNKKITFYKSKDKSQVQSKALTAFKSFEDRELERAIRERNLIILMQKNIRGYIVRQRAARERFEIRSNRIITTIQAAVRGHLERKRFAITKLKLRATMKLQSFFRAYRRYIDSTVLLRKNLRSLRALRDIIRVFRGYVARKRTRYTRARNEFSLEKIYNILNSNSNHLTVKRKFPFTTFQEVQLSEKYWDVVLYVNSSNQSVSWRKPNDIEQYDYNEYQELLNLYYNGFSKKQLRIAKLIQQNFRDRRSCFWLRAGARALCIMANAEHKYLLQSVHNNEFYTEIGTKKHKENSLGVNDLCHRTNLTVDEKAVQLLKISKVVKKAKRAQVQRIALLTNYALYRQCIELDYDKARELFEKLVGVMSRRGPDIALIIAVYAIFLLATGEEEIDVCEQLIYRAKEAKFSNFQLVNLELGFYRYRCENTNVLSKQDKAKAYLTYALFLQYFGSCTKYMKFRNYFKAMKCTQRRTNYILEDNNVDKADLEKSDLFYIRAIQANPYDNNITENYSNMLQNIKKVDYDAYEALRDIQLEN